MVLPNLRVVQQLKRGVRNGVCFRDKPVLHKEPAQFLIGHGILQHMAAFPAVGVVDQAANGDRFHAFLNIHADQPLEDGHTSRVQLCQPLGQGIEREDVCLLNALVQVVVFLDSMELQIWVLSVLQPELFHRVEKSVIRGWQIQLHFLIGSVGAAECADMEYLIQESSLPSALQPPYRWGTGGSAHRSWDQRQGSPSHA